MAAWERVKVNKGTYGVDLESIADFESNLKDNLYKIWNRMSSGSYFPPAVRGVEIPKRDGSKTQRLLSIPTVSDRVAQAVVKSYLEPIVEPIFHEDSYGYKPGKSALDALVHCSSKMTAEKVQEAIRVRLKECGLELHLDKTKIVYCKDVDRKGSHEYESFDFLGYTFRPRLSKNRKGKMFVNFTPAISRKAAKRIKKEIRSWKLHLRSDKNIGDLARMFNSVVQGWVNYYGRYYKSAMYPYLRNIEQYLTRWVMRKYKRYQGHKRRARKWLGCVRKREPKLFVHWRIGLGSPIG